MTSEGQKEDDSTGKEGSDDHDDDRPLEVPFAKKPIRDKGGKNYFHETNAPRDPRFDPRCAGSSEARHFVRNYAFLDDVRQKEMAELEKALKREKDSRKRDKIKMALGRYRNKMIDLRNKAEPKRKRSDKKAHLVQQFKELKEAGKLSKYLERKRKKLIKRDQKAFER